MRRALWTAPPGVRQDHAGGCAAPDAIMLTTIRGKPLPTEYLWVPPAAAMLLGYLLGSIPFGVMLTRACSARATCARSARAISARPTCCAPGARDWRRRPCCSIVAKGAAAVLLAGRLFPGHRRARRLRRVSRPSAIRSGCKFKGGKGVATLDGHLPRALLAVGLVYAASGSGCSRRCASRRWRA